MELAIMMIQGGGDETKGFFTRTELLLACLLFSTAGKKEHGYFDTNSHQLILVLAVDTTSAGKKEKENRANARAGAPACAWMT